MTNFPDPTQSVDEEAQDQKRKLLEQQIHREMQRTSQDQILVANPTLKNYLLDWDGFKHTIPAQGTKQLPRYLALKYIREMKDQLINEMATEKFVQKMAERSKKGQAELTPFERQEIWNRTFSTQDPQLLADIYPKLWLGVVEEYGMDTLSDDASARMDFRSEEQKILDQLSKKRVEVPSEVKNESVESLHDLDQAKENALKGVKA